MKINPFNKFCWSSEEIVLTVDLVHDDKVEEDIDIEEEGVDVITAGDDDVCVVCEDISDSGPYDLDVAEALIPAHPWCRCAFAPAGKYERDAVVVHSTDAAPEAAGVLFRAPSGHLLLMRRADTGEWSIPAGMLEENEEPLHGAQREAAEETGWPGSHLARKLHEAETRGVHFHTFVQPTAWQFAPIMNEEHTDYGWFRPRALPTPLHPGLEKTLRVTRLTDAEWREEEHPRGEHGRWGTGSGGKQGKEDKDAAVHKQVRESSLKKPLSKYEISALNYYSSYQYDHVNKALRFGDEHEDVKRDQQMVKEGAFGKNPDGSNRDPTNETIRSLRTAMDKVSLSRPLDGYRSVGKDLYSKLDQMSEKGGTFTDKGFVSVTSSREWLDPKERPSKSKGLSLFSGGSKKNIVEVHIPKGSRAIPLADISRTSAKEREVLIHDDAKFAVSKEKGVIHLTLKN